MPRGFICAVSDTAQVNHWHALEMHFSLYVFYWCALFMLWLPWEGSASIFSLGRVVGAAVTSFPANPEPYLMAIFIFVYVLWFTCIVHLCTVHLNHWSCTSLRLLYSRQPFEIYNWVYFIYPFIFPSCWIQYVIFNYSFIVICCYLLFLSYSNAIYAKL